MGAARHDRPSHPPRPEDEPVRRIVNPYTTIDWLRVVRRNLSQRPATRGLDRAPWVASTATVDPEVRAAVRIGFLGDLMPVRSRRVDIDVMCARYLGACDHVIANFEGTLWPGPGDPPPVFTSQHHVDLRVLEALDRFVAPSRLVLSVANNHAADYGWTAHRHTVDTLAARGHPIIGARGHERVRLAGALNVAAATQWTNQDHHYLPMMGRGPDPAATALVDPDAAGQLLVAHWGNEIELAPRPGTVALARHLLDHWDAVVGHHPHVPNPISSLDHGGRPRLVAWSLGQAVSDLRWPIYRHGLVLRAELGPRPDGSWGVGAVDWRFLAVSNEPDEVRISLRSANRWFPGVSCPVGADADPGS